MKKESEKNPKVAQLNVEVPVWLKAKMKYDASMAGLTLQEWVVASLSSSAEHSGPVQCAFTAPPPKQLPPKPHGVLGLGDTELPQVNTPSPAGKRIGAVIRRHRTAGGTVEA